MAKEIGSLGALRPELDGVRERVHGLTVAADEGAAEIDMLELMLFRLQIGYLSDVVTIDEEIGSISLVLCDMGDGKRGFVRWGLKGGRCKGKGFGTGLAPGWELT